MTIYGTIPIGYGFDVTHFFAFQAFDDIFGIVATLGQIYKCDKPSL